MFKIFEALTERYLRWSGDRRHPHQSKPFGGQCKKVVVSQASDRSRGGRTTKRHDLADDPGRRPRGMMFSATNIKDISMAEALIAAATSLHRCSPRRVMPQANCDECRNLRILLQSSPLSNPLAESIAPRARRHREKMEIGIDKCIYIFLYRFYIWPKTDADMGDELTALKGTEQAALISARRISPVELVAAYLTRIERWNDQLRAWITVDGDRALAAARQAENEIMAGRYRGPLHGIPYGVKDQLHAAGFPTTLGTRVLDATEMMPPGNATVIERLEAAGAILLGKQNLHEFGKGGTLIFPYGQPRNPWNPEYSASSSSTGSGIAPAARMCTFSLGEDTGGSIRGPAALNGVAGLRPTYGRVSRHGAVMAAYTSDTIGPLARSVSDIAHVLEAIAGPDARDPLCSRRPTEAFSAGLGTTLKGRRLGVIPEVAWGDGTTDEVKQVFSAALDVLRDLGAEIVEVSLPLALYAVPLQLLSADADVAAWFVEKYMRERYQRFDVGTRTRLAASAIIPATIYNRAMRARVIVRQQILDAVGNVDALVCPTMIRGTKPIDQESEEVSSSDEAVTRLMERRIGVYPFSLANVPAISVPMGFSTAGLPLALQFAARPFGEAPLLAVAHAYEQATGWWRQTPDLDVTMAPMAA